MTQSTCAVEGCERPRYQRQRMCGAHYFRLRRNGDVGSPNVSDRIRKKCAVSGCADLAVGRGYCNRHYLRLRSYGSVDHVTPRPVRDGHWAWKGDEAGYGSIHQRLRVERGPASAQGCVDCGGQAHHWSFDYTDLDAHLSAWGPYSSDLDCYQPRCASCHRKFDNAQTREVVDRDRPPRRSRLPR